MTSTEQQQKGQEILNTIIKKSWEDESFKQELIANPVAAIEKLTGKKLNIPEGKTLVVQDQTNKHFIYINIPTKRDLDDIELNEKELEIIAGGRDFRYRDHPILNWIIQ
ncbi:NHLP leader peptide family RiPP precursor [Aquimarina sp. ERC-38]|uniref:NHLP leader peptide family RiPP precursor n=1 Tax=Aquimarina sp. ERC-38 TaxID=2949996 RepID=UPI002245887D|nr:NHLP leader peptide family RiPP precursor [Aquimarina sp. ERC-38]UZO82187.1 NHLP leader peptide family RiPP precursor [Aquimarina sp. ERC-38]